MLILHSYTAVAFSYDIFFFFFIVWEIFLLHANQYITLKCRAMSLLILFSGSPWTRFVVHLNFVLFYLAIYFLCKFCIILVFVTFPLTSLFFSISTTFFENKRTEFPLAQTEIHRLICGCPFPGWSISFFLICKMLFLFLSHL